MGKGGTLVKFSPEGGTVLKTAVKKISVHNQSSHNDDITVAVGIRRTPHPARCPGPHVKGKLLLRVLGCTV